MLELHAVGPVKLVLERRIGESLLLSNEQNCPPLHSIFVARRRILDASSRQDARLHNPPEAQVRCLPDVTWCIYNEESIKLSIAARRAKGLRIEVPNIMFCWFCSATRVKMAPSLPAEVLYMILDQLRDERDYNTIYQFALSSKYFTEPALTILYQYVPTWNYGVHICWLMTSQVVWYRASDRRRCNRGRADQGSTDRRLSWEC